MDCVNFVDFSSSILDKLNSEASLPVGSAITRFAHVLSVQQFPSVSLSNSPCTYFTCADTFETSYDLWLALPVPSPSQLSQLRQGLAEVQAGSLGLDVPSLEVSYAHHLIYLPAYVVNLWSRLSTIIQHCKAWATARSVLVQLANADEDSAPLAQDMLNRLSFIAVDSPIPALLYFRTSHLPDLITNSWLSDDHMNAGAQFINLNPQRASSVYVFDTFWIPHLHRNLERCTNGAVPRPNVADCLVASGTATDLMIPIHQPSHWAFLYVDVTRRRYSFCDTLDPRNTSGPSEYADLVSRWLSRILGTSVTLVPAARPFELGYQTDGHSCGVAVLSTMACYALGHPFPSWTQPTTKFHRLSWALWLSSTLLPADYEYSSSSTAEPSGPAPSSPTFTPVIDLSSAMSDSDSISSLSDNATHTPSNVSTSQSNVALAKPPLRQTILPFKSVPRNEWRAQEKRRYHDRREDREQQMVLLERHKAQEEMERRQYNRDRKRDQRKRQKEARMLLMGNEAEEAINSLVSYLIGLRELTLIS